MRSRVAFGVLALCASMGKVLVGQQPTPTPGDTTPRIELAGEAGEDPVRRNHLRRPEFDLGFTTFHVGVGLLVDFASLRPER